MRRSPLVVLSLALCALLGLPACGGGGGGDDSGTNPPAPPGDPAVLVINEVDYDNPTADDAEFIEIHNPSPVTVSLADVAISLINGSGGNEYARIDLSQAAAAIPAGSYVVYGDAAVLAQVPGGIPTIATPGSGDLQNGAPDGIALINTATNSLIDALSYEGEITQANIPGFAGPVSLVEGIATVQVDEQSANSLVRTPNGQDTNDASVDWGVDDTPTPGAENN